MSYSLARVNAAVQTLWPESGAEEWDACGPVSGDPEAEVSRIQLVVDVVTDTVDEAIAADADLIIAHHPLLLRGVSSVYQDRYKGALLAKLIRADCALISVHTSADVVVDGVSDILVQRLGVLDAAPIVLGATPGTGIGRAGRLAEPTTVGRLARALGAMLPATASGVRVAGEYAAPVHTVSLCGGAGDSLLREAAVVASDAFITADLRHHPASEAREQARHGGGPALIDVSHWASEWLWLETAAAQLTAALPELAVHVSDLRTDPWDFVVVQ